MLFRSEKPSPNRFQPDFFLPISFFFLFLFFFFFFLNIFFLASDLSLLQPEPSQGSAPRGCPSLRLRERTRALRRAKKEEKLVGGVSPAHSNPLLAKPKPPAKAIPRLGKVPSEPTALLDLEEATALAVELDLF